MKTVYAPKELIHRWVHHPEENLRSPKNRPVFSDGGTLYSYGHHYPMGRIITTKHSHATRILLINPMSSSVTTNKYMGQLRYAANYLIEFSIPPKFWNDIVEGRFEPVVAYKQELVDEELKSAHTPGLTARSRVSRFNTAFRHEADYHAMTIHILGPEWAGRVSIPQAEHDYIAQFREKAKQQEADISARRNARWESYEQQRRVFEAQYAKTHTDDVEKWRADSSLKLDVPVVGPYPTKGDFLRLVPHPTNRDADRKRIETSRGVMMTYAEGQKVHGWLSSVTAESEAPTEELEFGGFHGVSFDGRGLRIGCHFFLWTEVAAFCKHAGWTVPPIVEASISKEASSCPLTNPVA